MSIQNIELLVLSAILLKKESKKEDVINFIDFKERIVITNNELDNILCKLNAKGLIAKNKKNFFYSKQFDEKKTFKEIEKLAKELLK